MKLIFEAFAFGNCLGCLIGMALMIHAFAKEDLVKTQPEWNIVAFLCVAGCFFGFLREIYSVLGESHVSAAAYPFKFTTSLLFLITMMFYKLSIKSTRIYTKEK